MTKKIEPVPQWTGYEGNKRKLIPLLMSLIPKHSETFVDLFGGTGIVGANAYHFNRCEKVVYNDLEYDLVKLLKHMHETDPEDIVARQNEIIDRTFGEDTSISKDNKTVYIRMLDYYNEFRIMTWDNKRGKEDFEWAYDMKMTTDGSGDRGDWNLLLFLIKHSFRQTPKSSDQGRRFSMTPNYAKLKRDDRDLLGFCKAWHETPVEFFSCDFTTAHLFGKQHQRPRPEEDMARFRDTISNLTSKDFVFIDPPYLGSKASYNSKWGQTMEVYLMAFCQLLAERKVPFLITNNLAWNTSLFTEWRKQFHCYMIAKDAVKLYANKEANGLEVFVSNKSLPKSKYNVHEHLERLPKGK